MKSSFSYCIKSGVSKVNLANTVREVSGQKVKLEIDVTVSIPISNS